jgi:predicted permease
MKMESLIRDSRFSIRTFFKSPGFVAIIAFSIALGTSATITVFSWIHTLLLDPISGVAHGDRLVTLETKSAEEYMDTSYPDYKSYRDQAKSLSGITVFKEKRMSVGNGDQGEWVWGELVSGNFFDVLGVKPRAGRFFSTEEQQDIPGAHAVAVISSRLWERSYHSDPGTIGRTVKINRYPFTIIGVAPDDFKGTIVGLSYDIWVPVMMQNQLTGEDWLASRDSRPLHTIARLGPDIDISKANLELKNISQQLAQAFPESNQGISAVLLPIWKAPYGAQSVLATLLGILMGVALVVLLIVCANIANLLLTRATAREKEISVRLAVGATRRRIVSQLFIESLLLSMIGSAVGILFTFWMKDSLRLLLPLTDLPIALGANIDGTLLIFSLLLSVFAAVLFGLAPALQATKVNLSESLNKGGRSGSGANSQRLRRLFVVSEVALALVALIGAGLFIKSFQNAKNIDIGFDPDHVLLVGMNLSPSGLDRAQGKIFYQQLRERIQNLPGVRAATYAEDVPLGLGGGSWAEVEVQGYLPQPGENMRIYRNIIAPGYFDLMRIPLLQGRDFTEQDDGKASVVIVNETFAKHFFGNANPIGRVVKYWDRPVTVVGIVKDAKYRTLREDPRPYMYLPFRELYRTDMGMAIHIRTAGDPGSLLSQVRREIKSLDPDVAIVASMTLEQYIGASFFTQRLAVILLSILGGISLLLAILGLYGVTTYSVTQRTQEFGIRLALGAQRIHVTKLVLREGLTLVVVGIILGLIGAVGLTRVTSSLLYGIAGTDFVTFIAASVVLTVVALAASYLPARRATKIDPLLALRYQ